MVDSDVNSSITLLRITNVRIQYRVKMTSILHTFILPAEFFPPPSSSPQLLVFPATFDSLFPFQV